MNEVIYFSTFQVLIETSYNEINNVLSYSSHKNLEANEREVIDLYVLNHIAPKTKYFSGPSSFRYSGIAQELELNLNRFLFHGIIRDVLKHKLEIDHKVNDLIGHSLTNYYFEKVGEQILELKKLYDSKNAKQLYYETCVLEKLLNAYNQNAETEFKLESIVPDKIFNYFMEQKKFFTDC